MVTGGESLSVRVIKSEIAGDLSFWLQKRGWFLSVVSLDERIVWIQAFRGKSKLEAEMRGMGDLVNACRTLMAMVEQVEIGCLKGKK